MTFNTSRSTLRNVLSAAVVVAALGAFAGPAAAGSVTGPGVYGTEEDPLRVAAGGRFDIAEAFRGGQVAEVTLRGDGDTGVDLVIYDENGNSVCEATSSNDYETCRWTPAWTGGFTIRLRNYGGVYNQAQVLVN